MEKEEEEEEVVETPATPLPEELQAVVVEVVKEEEKIPVTEEDVEEVPGGDEFEMEGLDDF